jgi:hypothetical protein
MGSNGKSLTTKVVGLDDTSIWTYGRPNSDQGARRYGPRNASCVDKSEIRQIIFWGCFGILSSFPRKAINTKVNIILLHTTWTPNLHYLESGRGRYGAGKEGLRIRKIWTRLILWKPSFLLSQGGSRARQGGARPKAPQEHKYNPLGVPRWLPIDIHSSESRRRSPQGGGRRGLAATPPELEDGEDWSSSDASTTFNGTMLSILME